MIVKQVLRLSIAKTSISYNKQFVCLLEKKKIKSQSGSEAIFEEKNNCWRIDIWRELLIHSSISNELTSHHISGKCFSCWCKFLKYQKTSALQAVSSYSLSKWELCLIIPNIIIFHPACVNKLLKKFFSVPEIAMGSKLCWNLVWFSYKAFLR